MGQVDLSNVNCDSLALVLVKKVVTYLPKFIVLKPLVPIAFYFWHLYEEGEAKNLFLTKKVFVAHDLNFNPEISSKAGFQN
eukprot:snap_masked-scaffold_21-processed-gene-2.35-mRNA-1 protein AED:1.00 eAED:1.00 QI:0/0/0/0/1/1/3/0/80